MMYVLSVYIFHLQILRTFDETISKAVTEETENTGVKIKKRTQVVHVETMESKFIPLFLLMTVFLQVKSVAKEPNGELTVETNTGTIHNVNTLIWAIGRKPLVDLGLEHVVSAAAWSEWWMQ